MQPEPWRTLFEQSVHAYYEGDREAGQTACERLLARTDIPHHIRDLTRQNQTYYARQLVELAPSTEFRRLDVPVAPGWSAFNPSIAASAEGLRCIVRSANYWFGYGVPTEFGPVGHSNSYLLELDHDLAVGQTVPLRDETDPALRFPVPVQDYEDCRLFALNGEWYALGTAQDRNPDRIYRMCLLAIEDGAFRRVRVLGETEHPTHEKNWAPLIVDDVLYLIYSAFPTVVFRCDPALGIVTEHVRHQAPPVARNWRGGSQAIPFDDGFLMLVHETVPFAGPQRTYRHRWVLLDQEFRIHRCSPQFAFLYRGVEFAAGLVQHGEQVIASFGVNDREAYLAIIRSDEIRALLLPAWEQTLAPELGESASKRA